MNLEATIRNPNTCTEIEYAIVTELFPSDEGQREKSTAHTTNATNQECNASIITFQSFLDAADFPAAQAYAYFFMTLQLTYKD